MQRADLGDDLGSRGGAAQGTDACWPSIRLKCTRALCRRRGARPAAPDTKERDGQYHHYQER